jgi:hypothetical protein
VPVPLPPAWNWAWEITCRACRPRRPRESPLFRLFEQYPEELQRVWPPRLVRQHGPLRPVVERALREFLKCGLLEHGFARLWCSKCRRPGLVASLSTAGDLLQCRPHLHLLTTDGGFAPDGSFIPVPVWDATLLMTLFRERILARLLDRHAISQELVQRLLAWRHPGFSAHLGEAISPQDKQRLDDTAAYLVRNALSLKKLVYLDGQQAVLCRSRMNPSLGRNFEALDPLEWLARISDHIPDPGQYRTILYGEYSNRVTGARQRPEPDLSEQTAAEPSRRRCSPAGARLIAKVHQVDPLLCTRCGQQMTMVAFLTDQLPIRTILDLC